MYDNLPFRTDNIKTITSLLNGQNVIFQKDGYKYKESTGEPLRTAYFKYKNLRLTVDFNENGVPFQLVSRGSFHYLMNEGKHNANQYTFEDMRAFLLKFQEDFKIDLQTLHLLPPEFAVNFPIPFEVEKVVQNIFFEQRKPFNTNSPGNPSKISGKTCNDYRLKIYSKSHQYPDFCQPNTIRLEYQAKKMRALHRLGISSLQDLLNLKNWIKIKEFHLNYFQYLLIYDYTIRLPRNSKHQRNLKDLSNFIYWENLIKDCSIGEKYNTKYNDNVNNLNSLSKRYGTDLLSNILLNAKNQWNTNLGTCYNYAYSEVKKLKVAPLSKTKDAPFIVCNPCHYNKKQLPNRVLQKTEVTA